MSAAEQIDFISNCLGPKLEKANINTEIIGYDHNYDDTDYPSEVTARANKYIAGAGFHHYTSDIRLHLNSYQNKVFNLYLP